MTSLEIAKRAIADILAERNRQDEKWGVQDHAPDRWLRIIKKELGEASAASLWTNWEVVNPACEYRRKLVEVAASAMAAIENFDRQIERNHDH